MAALARLAVGTIPQCGDVAAPRPAESTALVCALRSLLARRGISTQSFLSQATFVSQQGRCTAAERPRHLDSWLMPAEMCREVFAHGTPPMGIGLVEGVYERPLRPGEALPGVVAPSSCDCDSPHPWPNPGVQQGFRGGTLNTLCDWLDLPKLVILDASRLDCCQQPPLPPAAAGVLLDCVESTSHAVELSTRLSALWGIPVLGALGRLPRLRAALDALPTGVRPSTDVLSALATALESSLCLDALLRLATARPWPAARPSLFCERDTGQRPCIAVAHDEVFRGYFQETLDVLELRGARIEVFSPLRDETLPLGTDVVYIGCGHPERYAAALADNTCLLQDLRQHLCSGQRIYGEGGGMAYLCQQIELSNGRRHAMVGALPAIARVNETQASPTPVELTLSRGNWLGEGWSRIRGYRNPRWEIEPTGPLVSHAFEPEHALDLVGRHQAIGSRVHINFAAQLDYLNSFFQPHAAALDTAAV